MAKRCTAVKASLKKRWSFGKFTPEEDALDAHVYARAEAVREAGRVEQLPTHPRFEEFLQRISAGERLNAAEFSEMKSLDQERQSRNNLIFF
jgi:hypothetical protein